MLCRAKAGAAGGSDSARAIHSCAPAASPVSAQHSTIPSEASRSTWPKPERAAVATSSRKAPAASSAYPVTRSMVATAQASQAAWNRTPCSTATSRPAGRELAGLGRPAELEAGERRHHEVARRVQESLRVVAAALALPGGHRGLERAGRRRRCGSAPSPGRARRPPPSRARPAARRAARSSASGLRPPCVSSSARIESIERVSSARCSAVIGSAATWSAARPRRSSASGPRPRPKNSTIPWMSPSRTTSSASAPSPRAASAAASTSSASSKRPCS